MSIDKHIDRLVARDIRVKHRLIVDTLQRVLELDDEPEWEPYGSQVRAFGEIWSGPIFDGFNNYPLSIYIERSWWRGGNRWFGTKDYNDYRRIRQRYKR